MILTKAQRKHRVLSIAASAAAICMIAAGTMHVGHAEEIQAHDCSQESVCYPNDGNGYNAAQLKQIANDMSANGENSKYYAQFKRYMDLADSYGDGDKRGNVKMTNGSTMEFRLIGMNHDDKADGTGKAGLTFMATDASKIPAHAMFTSSNYTYVNGGWRDTDLRKQMNSGDIWTLMPQEFQSNISPVIKITDNGPATGSYYKKANVSSTVDKLWLISYNELVETSYWHNAIEYEGSQYYFFKNKVTQNSSPNTVLNSSHIKTSDSWWWERSSSPGSDDFFLRIDLSGDPSNRYGANFRRGVVPCFSF